MAHLDNKNPKGVHKPSPDTLTLTIVDEAEQGLARLNGVSSRSYADIDNNIFPTSLLPQFVLYKHLQTTSTQRWHHLVGGKEVRR